MNISLIALTAVIMQNVCFTLGFGTLGVISHKKHSVFMIASNLMILLMSIISSAIYYLLYNSVFVPLDLTELALFAATLIVLLVDFCGMMILKRVGAETYYHYEKNFTFVIHAIVVLGLVLSSSLSLDFWHYVYSVSMQFVGLFLVSIIFFCLNSRINNKRLPEQVRALPPQLALMGVLSLIAGLIAGLIV